ncbi:MAG: 6-carboxytetrahydropterin synthase QueD [Candidatus Omnitrophica bacterium]|nr:6-carboxytetrahydropterin synthase QueD [Candidatus Omnitrophota bacterium]
MFELTIKGDIASAHFLRGYQGKCKDLHGHTWIIEITVMSDQLDSIGMVADFKILKAKLKDFLMTIDHVCLNDLAYFKEHNPTTENLAKYIYDGYSQNVQPIRVKHVRVWESPTSSVTYFPG